MRNENESLRAAGLSGIEIPAQLMEALGLIDVSQL